MATINIDVRCDLNKPVTVRHLDGMVFSQDVKANRIRVSAFRDGSPVDLSSGSVSANIIRADGATVVQTGTISDNVCSVVLPSSAYAVPGAIAIFVKHTNSGTTSTIAAVTGYVYKSTTDTIVDPGTVVPNVNQLLAMIEDCEDATAACIAATAAAPVIDDTAGAGATNKVWSASKSSELKNTIDDYTFGLNETFSHTGTTGWDFFPCLLLKGVAYKIHNNDSSHTMAIKIRKQDSTEYSCGSASANGNIYFIVPADGYIEIGGYMYDGKSFTVTNEYSDYKTVSGKANNDNLIHSNCGIETFGIYGHFQHFGLKADGSFLFTQPYRVSNDDVMSFDRELVVNVASGFRWGYIPFVNETAGTWSGWFTTQQTINANTSFVVQIARVTENTSEIADVSEFVNAVTFMTAVGDSTSKIPTIMDSIGMYALQTTWVSGGIGSSGGDSVDDRRIRTGYIEMSDFLDISTNQGYYSVIVQYDETYTMVIGTDWASGRYMIQKHENAKYFRCALAKTISGTTTIDVSESTNIAIKRGYENIGGRLVTIENEMLGGSHQYEGEKIPSKANSFSTKRLFRMTYDGTTDTPQDMDIYGSYLVIAFAKNNNQSIRIYSMEDYSLLANITVDVQHGSGIQFSNEFYDASDIMPLLYVGGWTTNEINVIRITKSGNTWSASIIRTLKISTDQGYYLAPSIDSKNNILYCYGYKIQSLSATNNAMELIKCDLANLTNNGDGTYSPAVISRIETPYLGVMQGRKYYKNRLYIGFANTSGSADCRLVCVDVSNGETKSDIDLSEITTLESEGVCFQIVGNSIIWYYSDFYYVYEFLFS